MLVHETELGSADFNCKIVKPLLQFFFKYQAVRLSTLLVSGVSCVCVRKSVKTSGFS